MVFDNFVEITVKEKTYKMCLKNRCAFLAERELASKNLLKALENQPITMNDLFVLFKWGLIGGGAKGTEDDFFELYTDAIAELTFIGVFEKVINCLMLSGLLGDPKNLPATKV